MHMTKADILAIKAQCGVRIFICLVLFIIMIITLLVPRHFEWMFLQQSRKDEKKDRKGELL
jgi:hypothetical protein